MHIAFPQALTANQPLAWLAIFVTTALPAALVAESPISEFEGLSIVGWSDAAKVVGTTAIVTGKIVDVGKSGRVNFLNFDSKRRDVFKIVVFDANLRNFPKSLDEMYHEKLIAVRGRVSLYRDVPQIEVTSASQIRIVRKLPATRIIERTKRKLTKRVRIATLNTRNLFDDQDDPYFQDETTPAKPRVELVRLADTIKEIDADAIALQEVESRGYLKLFNDVFLEDMSYEVVHYAGNDQRGSGLAVLSRIPIGGVVSHRHRRFVDSHGKSRRFSRDLLCVELLHPAAPSFEVWVTHLKSKRDGPAKTEPQRLAETTEIRRILNEHLQIKPNNRILLVGDFNDTLESNPLQNLMHGGQLRNFTERLPVDSVTYTLPPHQAMIDFIFASPAAAKGYVSNSYRIMGQSLQQSGSDHNAVIAEFEF